MRKNRDKRARSWAREAEGPSDHSLECLRHVEEEPLPKEASREIQEAVGKEEGGATSLSSLTEASLGEKIGISCLCNGT